MLRIYDNRVRCTDRSDTVYLAKECEDIVGTSETIFELEGYTDADSKEPQNEQGKFWNGKGSLKIISIPYRKGSHIAKTPNAFLPIIDQLEKLHKAGFVHGDIRAFNTVFGDNEKDGWLIDFDFGGRSTNDSPKYPPGYKSELGDGLRIGEENDVITKWHDWYALYHLIFSIHTFNPKNDMEEIDKIATAYKLYKLATNVNTLTKQPVDPSNEDRDSIILQIKWLLGRLKEEEWVVSPGPKFLKALIKCGSDANKIGPTKQTATGSPPHIPKK